MELCNNFPILPLLGINHCLPLFNMYKSFVYLKDAEEHINEFAIAYMVNPILHVNKSYKGKVEKCMNDTFGTIKQPFIRNTSEKKYLCFRISNVS